jgi:hypothetical protein
VAVETPGGSGDSRWQCSLKPHEVIVYAGLYVKLCNEFIASSNIEYIKMLMVLSNKWLSWVLNCINVKCHSVMKVVYRRNM